MGFRTSPFNPAIWTLLEPSKFPSLERERLTNNAQITIAANYCTIPLSNDVVLLPYLEVINEYVTNH